MKILAPDTEQLAILAMLEHRKTRGRTKLLAELRPEDFGTDEGREIRKRIGILVRKNHDVDGFSVSEFREDPALSDESVEFLEVGDDLVRKAARLPAKRAKAVVAKLHELRKIRSLYAGVKEVADLCSEDYQEDTFKRAEEALLDTVQAIREDRSKKVLHLGSRRTAADVKDWLRGKLKKREGQFVSTGLRHLDQHIRGWDRGSLVVMSAPRGGGKTAMLLQMAVEQFRQGYNVGIASLEMEEDQLTDRLIANVTDTKYSQVRLREHGESQEGQEEKSRIANAWRDFEMKVSREHGNVFSVWELKDPNYKPANLELDMGQMGYDIIFVDYLSLFSSGRNEMWVAQKEHGRYLKQLAGRIRPKTVIVLLTQLSDRERVKYGTGPEEDADYWLWWRYGDEESESGVVDLRLDKARHARRGVIPARFALDRMQLRTTGGLKTAMSSYTENQQKRGGPRRDGKKQKGGYSKKPPWVRK